MNTGLNKDHCGGCGETDGNKRCIGCLHPFTTASAPEVSKIVPGDDILASERAALIKQLHVIAGFAHVYASDRQIVRKAADMLAADAQPKPVFVRESDLDLDDLNKVLIDYRDQIARLRARIAVLDPVFSDAEGYQLSVISPQLLTDGQICEIANRDFPKSDLPLYFARDIEAAIINKGGAA